MIIFNARLKCGVKINLRAERGLWTLHTKHPHVAASLRLGQGGKTDSATWHERLGHPSDHQTKMTIDKNVIPNEAQGRKEGECDVYLRSKPNRLPIPKTPEKSGDVVIQIRVPQQF